MLLNRTLFMSTNETFQKTSTLPSLPEGFYRHPKLMGDLLFFISEEDLWCFDLKLEKTHRLTENMHIENAFAISSDQRYIAFPASPDGIKDLYLISTAGGQSKRLTYTGGVKKVCHFDQAGVVWFIASIDQPFRESHLYTIDAFTPKAKHQLHLQTTCEHFSPIDTNNGGFIIQKKGYGYGNWKNYQGGLAGEIFSKPNEKSSLKQLVASNHNMLQPFFYKGRVYFLSDMHNDCGNIFSVDLTGRDLQAHTAHKDFYIRSFHIHDDTLVYDALGTVHAFDLNTAEEKILSIPYPSNTNHKVKHFDSAHMRLTQACLLHGGQKLVVIKRGVIMISHIWRNGLDMLLKEDGMRFRLLVPSHDDEHFWTIGDDGENDFLFSITYLDNIWQVTEKHPLAETGRVHTITASPCKKKLVFSNYKNELMSIDPKTFQSTVYLQNDIKPFDDFSLSPDGRWIALTHPTNHDRSHILLLDTENHSTTPISNLHIHAFSPCFEPQGQRLYFLTDDHFSAQMDPLLFQYNFKSATHLQVALLNKETSSPFEPKLTNANKNHDLDKKNDKKKEKKSPVITKVDLEDIALRCLYAPLTPSAYQKIDVLENKLLLFDLTPEKHSIEPQHIPHTQQQTIFSYDLEGLYAKKLYDQINHGIVCHDLKHILLVYTGRKLQALSIGDDQHEDDQSYKQGGHIESSKHTITVDSEKEWLYMLKDAWNLQKILFWNDQTKALQDPKLPKKYFPYVKKANTRSEFNIILEELQGELGASHAYTYGGEYRFMPIAHRIGKLGVDTRFDPSSQGYLVTHVPKPQNGFDAQEIPPSQQAHIRLQVGDIITHINGQKLDENFDVDQSLVNFAHQPISLHISRGKEKLFFTLTLPAHMEHIQYRKWVERKRQEVKRLTSDRCGYVHIPDMVESGYAEFMRSFLASNEDQGLVIDIRYNRGGHASSMILQKIITSTFGLDITRKNQPIPFPLQSRKGPLVFICNEYTASDGEMLAHAVKSLKLGALIGKRTWGGVIGISPKNPLLDGAISAQPEFAAWFPDVGFSIENHGVDPDMIVDNTITNNLLEQDVDLQLQTACETLLDTLKKNAAIHPPS